MPKNGEASENILDLLWNLRASHGDEYRLCLLANRLATIKIADDKDILLIAQAIKDGEFGNNSTVLITLARNLAKIKLDTEKAQTTMASAICSERFGYNDMVLMSLVEILPKMNFTDPDAQFEIAQAIGSNSFGYDDTVLNSLAKILSKLNFTNANSQGIITRLPRFYVKDNIPRCHELLNSLSTMHITDKTAQEHLILALMSCNQTSLINRLEYDKFDVKFSIKSIVSKLIIRDEETIQLLHRYKHNQEKSSIWCYHVLRP